MRFLLLILAFMLGRAWAGAEFTQKDLEVFFVDSKPMDYYEFFGLNPEANQDEIKKAYRKLASLYHTGRPGHGDQEKFVRAARGWEIFSDPVKKAKYDSWLSDRHGTAAKAKPQLAKAKVYKKWEPPRYEANEPVYSDPRKKKAKTSDFAQDTAQDFANEAGDAAESSWRPRGGSTPIYSKKAKVNPFPNDPFEKISPKFLFEGELPNYFAAASISIDSTLLERKEAIMWKRIQMEAALAEAENSPAEKSGWEKRLRRLKKAEEILLDFKLQDEYLREAQKISLVDPVSGKITFADKIRAYRPEYKPKEKSNNCPRWYDFLFGARTR